MKQDKQGIWIGEKDLTKDPEFIKAASQEFAGENLLETMGANPEATNLESTRRDFLKFLGFGLGAATLAASCEIPVKRAIPYVIKPDEIVPGVANYYASSYVNGGDYCAILVKTREGRPIKIEGNSLSPITKGGTSARAQALVLDLYDLNRLREPSINGEEATWDDLDQQVKQKLAASSNIRILTNTILSPSAKAAITEFTEKFPNAKVVTYDPISSSAQLDANEESFGQRVIPNYKFEEADVIVSFDADFLGTWISPVEYATGYSKKRKIDPKNPKMSRHIQVESRMSLTGSNADNRILVKPSEQGAAILALYNAITGSGGKVSGLNTKAQNAIAKVAEELQAANGKSIVISASNNKAEQILVNAINNALGNIGNTVTFENASLQRQGNDQDLAELLSEMRAGSVDTLIINQANPVFDSPMMGEFSEALAKVNNTIALSYEHNETSALCNYVAPVNHILESWGDAEPKRGIISTIQPTIAPIFNTRQAEASMLVWADSENYDASSEQAYMDYVVKQWEEGAFAGQSEYMSFNAFRDNLLADGVLSLPDGEGGAVAFAGDVSSAAGSISKPANSEMEISLFESINLGAGQFASNPWLMEMPNPVTRCSWGNYLAVPVEFDGVRKMIGLNGLKDGDLATLTVNGNEYTVPVIQQFGQMPGTVALALGYGRTQAGRCGTGVGVNINPEIGMNEDYPVYYATNVSVSEKIGKEDNFSCVQYHHTMGVKSEDEKTGEMINADEAALVAFNYGVVRQGYQGALTDRSIIYNSHVDELEENLEYLHDKRHHAQKLNDDQIYPGYDDKYAMGHHWGMHIDLNACIGCGACTIACMAENNVPVVGKKEVKRHHEMTWLRIDRYYYGDLDNPNTVYQPMMCQHCDNAPCENVCPVNATNHSSEGLNQMAYNRCVGTRYCANNCPYKVRRFNWLDYTTADIFPANQPSLTDEFVFGKDNMTRMVLNPDVTVRSRGVIEKCSFCVQRIQEGKLTAKKEGRKLIDSDVRTACQTSCPTGAITFGDMNNKGGDLDKKLDSPLNYIVLEEVNVRSSVNYTMKVHNRSESLDA
ncbi:TAT-variant-translocated molybdopterin oxidoreductase [Portibacter marinus]|uniref:TAT-variant-translocated molybdopterin oxidoreductase n=1 Tax=Portibacter marinus TaxID=2898660 RepID=UPI001F1C6C0A|nr:TAT-variant-translocated molybdopterin oxidoreductase [Portibacter marinus]